MDIPQIDGVTVGYGEGDAMCDSWSDDVAWWEIVPPQEEYTRFRVFYPVSTRLFRESSST